ncbi:hypothetical protein RvY_08690 [Ramazzottius varieornatus]|uniref:RRM domain-containing protein n=1 Tax=Ramazzottius varieornatus TaxID=947166 RepID=A0A1D1V8Z9_RAMVA|nr:hypothetical protein RvY_08690 [Ramazzottius varieornatus]
MSTNTFAGFRTDIFARLAMATTKDASFGSGYEGVVIKRDELEDALTNARESATSVNDRDRLQKQVVKTLRCCTKFEDDCQDKLRKVGGVHDASVVEHNAKSAAQPSAAVKTAGDAPKSTDHAPKEPPSKPVEKAPGEQPPEVNAVIDFAKIRTNTRSTISKHDIQALKESKNAQVYFEQLNPNTTEDTLRQGLLDQGYQSVKIEMSTWKGGKTRGSAVVSMRAAEDALELVNRNDIEIDGWSASPKFLLADQVSPESESSSEIAIAQSQVTAEKPEADLTGKEVAEPRAAAASVTEKQEAVDEVRDNAAEDKAGQEGSTTTMSKKQKKAAKKAAAKLEKAAEHTSAEVSQKTEVSAASVQEPKKEEVNEEQGAKMEEKVEKPAENGTKKTEEKAEEKNPAQNGTKVEEEEKKKEKTNEPPKAKEPGQLESILPNGFIPSTHHAMGYLLERIKWGREDVSSAE